MQKKNIFVLLGHPNKDTFSRALVDAYAKSAEGAGHTVRTEYLGDLSFDPILHKGYKEIQELEPDLIRIQEHMRWADHLVIVYPNWWCTMPALLKGMFDRMYLPGFAFRFRKTGWGWEKLLKGKTARVIVLTGTRPILIRMLFGDFTNEIKRGILGFAGYSVRVSTFGPTEKASDSVCSGWMGQIERLARNAR